MNENRKILLSDREKWIYCLTVIKTSQTSKLLSMEQKQAILEFIRKKICPTIDNDEWLKIEKDMIKMKTEIMKLMYQGMLNSIGNSNQKSFGEMFEVSEIAKLDDSIRDSLKSLDFNKIELVFDSLPEDQKNDLEPIFKEVKKLANLYKNEKIN